MAIKKPDTLESLGFYTATSEHTTSLVLSVSGLEKAGKTHMAMTMPGPIAYINTDIGLRGVIEKFADQKDIHVLPVTVYHDGDAAVKEWDRFMNAMKYLVLDSGIRSIVLDTATELWELKRIAAFGKLTQVQPWHYGPVNADFRGLFRMFYDDKDCPVKNLIALHKMKAVYLNDKRTSDYERSGFSDMGYLAQASIRLYRDRPWVDADDVEHKGNFHAYIESCRHNPLLVGEDLETDMDVDDPVNMCSFSMLASLIVDGTFEEDWA